MNASKLNFYAKEEAKEVNSADPESESNEDKEIADLVQKKPIEREMLIHGIYEGESMQVLNEKSDQNLNEENKSLFIKKKDFSYSREENKAVDETSEPDIADSKDELILSADQRTPRSFSSSKNLNDFNSNDQQFKTLTKPEISESKKLLTKKSVKESEESKMNEDELTKGENETPKDEEELLDEDLENDDVNAEVYKETDEDRFKKLDEEQKQMVVNLTLDWYLKKTDKAAPGKYKGYIADVNLVQSHV